MKTAFSSASHIFWVKSELRVNARTVMEPRRERKGGRGVRRPEPHLSEGNYVPACSLAWRLETTTPTMAAPIRSVRS